MGLNYSVILCSAMVLCFTQDFVNCEGEWQVDYSTDVNHGKNGHAHTEHDSGLMSKHQHGGHKKGKEDWDDGAYKKNVQEWGKFGEQENMSKDKHGDNHWNKNGKNEHGEKWALTHGGYKMNDLDEFKNKEKFNKDKGNGYVKKWNWEKENGEKDAYGKKASHADHHHKKSQGHKHALKKYQDANAKKYGYKDYNSGKNWKNYGKKHNDHGHKKHGYKSWEQKKPEYQKLQKILKHSSHKKQHGH